jgi:hypothetical protein
MALIVLVNEQDPLPSKLLSQEKLENRIHLKIPRVPTCWNSIGHRQRPNEKASLFAFPFYVGNALRVLSEFRHLEEKDKSPKRFSPPRCWFQRES